MKKMTNAQFLKKVESLKKDKGFTYLDKTGKEWTGEMAIAKYFGMSRAQFRAKLKEAKTEEVDSTAKKMLKHMTSTPKPKKPVLTDVTIKGRIIPCKGDKNGKYYVELPDGYRLIFDDTGYIGRYDPDGVGA